MKTRKPSRTSRRAAVAAAIAMLVIACGLGGCRSGSTTAKKSTNPLLVDPQERDFSANPKLLERLTSSAHGYFRFVNLPFSEEICRRFGDRLTGTPAFNLHGDAHIEQYAVTDRGRGLTDFDDSTTGPAVIDLARFGVSLRLLTTALGYSVEKSSAELDRFLEGYKTALENPDYEPRIPALVKKIRAGFDSNRSGFLEFAESQMEPVEAAEEQALILSLAPYFDSMRAENPELPAEFFDVVSVGYLRAGIGSALDLKYLIRVRGLSAQPLDDVVLEVKEVRDLEGVSCIASTQRSDPFRILVGQSRIAYRPYRFLGYTRHREYTFWVHAWVDNYSELDVNESFGEPAELSEIVFDVGVQLGRGHPNQIAAPLDEQLRQEQLKLLARDRKFLHRLVTTLSRETITAWEGFRSRAAAP